MLTRRQRQLLTYIAEEINAGQQPSYRSMARAMNAASTNTVYQMVNQLVDRGHLHRESGRLKLGQRVMWLRFDANTQTLVPFTTRKAA